MNENNLPICMIMMGKAATGKTSFVNCLATYLHGKQAPPFVINLDPAVRSIPYVADIDIRDTINYKDVMHRHEMGPNGAIVTSLNLFATSFDKVIEKIGKEYRKHKYIIIDTPGQIEVYDRSASGTIITESLASVYPTVIVFLVDSLKASDPNTFIIDMLYASSILNKYKMPLMVTMNKTDLQDANFARAWMSDFTLLQDALLRKDTSYRATLGSSLCLAIEEFYRSLSVVGVSARTGAGLEEEFFPALDKAVQEYYSVYKPEYERLKQEVKGDNSSS